MLPLDLQLAQALQAAQGDTLPRLLTFGPGTEDMFDTILAAHPGFGRPLSEAYYEARAAFGPGTAVALERVTDPEGGEAMLYFTVTSPHGAGETSACYERFVEAWWIDNCDRMHGVHLGLEMAVAAPGGER